MVKSEHLIVDSGGFLKNADIRNLGENIYTVKEVITEIRDKATRQRLSVLPYEIVFKKPSGDAIQKVTELSKKTGDYPSLSAVDIQVLALTYELTKLHDPESLEEIPKKFENKFQFGASGNEKNEEMPGFYMPTTGGEKKQKQGAEQAENGECQMDSENSDVNTETDENNEIDYTDDVDVEEEEDDDGDGWITPGNFDKFQKDMEENEKDVKVACLTTDFAMQNILMKMNINVISVDGMRIKTIRSYVLRCHACFNITKIMTKVFCPKCGNNTLKRVPTVVQPDGSVKYYLSRNPKVLSKRGKKYSLPMPKGGKHCQNPIVCEDQPMPQNRISKKAMQKTDVWSDDYAINGTPFAVNETESRAFKLGIRRGNGASNGRRRNPNAVGKKYVKRR